MPGAGDRTLQLAIAEMSALPGHPVGKGQELTLDREVSIGCQPRLATCKMRILVSGRLQEQPLLEVTKAPLDVTYPMCP